MSHTVIKLPSITASIVGPRQLLQRLLDDRKPTVELIRREGGKVAELAESVDRDKVAREMEGLGQRWDALLKKAENRLVSFKKKPWCRCNILFHVDDPI